MVNKMPLISVILPVYNVEKYLPECIESLQKQTYKNLEMIFVDDGSTDNSRRIIEKYASRDKRIRLLTQENKGPGPARNSGLKAASGVFLSFIDSDDFLSADYYEQLMNNAACDIDLLSAAVDVVFDKNFPDKEIEAAWYSNTKRYSGVYKISQEIKNVINAELWNKIFRKSVFDRYSLVFRAGAFEDVEMLFKYLALSRKIVFVPDAVYYYRRRANSLVVSFKEKKVRKNYNIQTDAVLVCFDLYNFLSEQGLLDENYETLLHLFVRQYNYVYQQLSEADKQDMNYRASDFLEKIPNEVIDRSREDRGLLYRLKALNVYKPFYCNNVKKYDLKILVCYHKPSLLPEKDSVFIPIHVGRLLQNAPSKDGSMKSGDWDWLNAHMGGDETGDNISCKNREYCELTATYWAWKNYDKIGSPAYFGLAHYRRHFNFYGIDFNLSDVDILVARKWTAPCSVYEHYKREHHIGDLEVAIAILKRDFPDYAETADEYLAGREVYLLNMFVMKKEIFFKFSEWLFHILSKLEDKIDRRYLSLYNLRAIAFIAERLQDIFVLKMKKEGCVVREMPLLFPEESELALPEVINCDKNDKAKIIVTSTDDNYSLYAGVMISSLISHMAADENYRVFILNNGILPEHKYMLKCLENDRVQINFVDVSPYLSNFDLSLFHTNHHFTLATYFRFFIPEIFKNCERILYLDADLIVCENIAPLYDADLAGKLLGVCRDVETIRQYHSFGYRFTKEYADGILGLSVPDDYFQAGVMVMDIAGLRKFDFTEKCLQKLRQVVYPTYVDQDILNSVCQGKTVYFDEKWNLPWFLFMDNNYILNQLDFKTAEKIGQCFKKPGIIHYCSGRKPWSNPEFRWAEIWWRYARQVPFYEEILFKNLGVKGAGSAVVQVDLSVVRNLHRYFRNKCDYYRCKILQHLTFGKKKQHYADKRNRLKGILKSTRQFLKNKY